MLIVSNKWSGELVGDYVCSWKCITYEHKNPATRLPLSWYLPDVDLDGPWRKEEEEEEEEAELFCTEQKLIRPVLL